MDDYDVSLSEHAAQDISDIYEYICNTIGSSKTAMNQFNRIADAIETLSNFPERIKIMHTGYCKKHALRKLLVDNYSIIFTIRQKSVYIVRVLYSSSDIESRLKS